MPAFERELRKEAMNGSVDLRPPDSWLSLIEDAADLITRKLPPIVQIVEGIICEQSKLVIGSGSKSFKTWITMDMALSIAHGVQWWGRETIRLPVLYVNSELRPETFTRRLQVLAQAKQLKLDPGVFLHLPLRGRIAGCAVKILVDRIVSLATNCNRKVIICDPVYKMNTEGEENSSHDQTLFFNELDRITTEAGCTLILNDHFSKGNQSEKDPLDAIRGSSAKGGDVDAAMVLRNHTVKECFRVDVIHRELPPVDPFCVGWKFPFMELRPDLDPDDMKKSKGGRTKKHDPQELCAAIVESTFENPVTISAWAANAGITRQTLQGYLASLRAKGWIATAGEGNKARQYLTEKGKLAARHHLEERQ